MLDKWFVLGIKVHFQLRLGWERESACKEDIESDSYSPDVTAERMVTLRSRQDHLGCSETRSPLTIIHSLLYTLHFHSNGKVS